MSLTESQQGWLLAVGLVILFAALRADWLKPLRAWLTAKTGTVPTTGLTAAEARLAAALEAIDAEAEAAAKAKAIRDRIAAIKPAGAPPAPN